MDALIIDFEDDLFIYDRRGVDNAAQQQGGDEDDEVMAECDDVPLSKDGYTPHRPSDANKSWWSEDSSSDDEDDDIIITIDRESYAKRMETNKLKEVLEHSYYPTLPIPSDDRQSPYYHGYKNAANKTGGGGGAAVYQLRPDDIELNNEVDRLIAKSVNLRTTDVITVFVRNTLILVPTDVPISSRLADCIWPPEKTLTAKFEFNNMHLFNRMMPETDRTETMAFFAARYKRVHVGTQLQYRPPQSTQHQLAPPVPQNTASGQYLYDDFALVIVVGGKVVDAAIHGVRGNINDLVAKYKPRRIYCNTMPDDALHVFLRYPYQPFYQSFQNLMVPFFVDTTKVGMSTVPFCDRYDPFCAFCKALLTVRGFFQQHIPNTPRFVQRIRVPTCQRRVSNGKRPQLWCRIRKPDCGVGPSVRPTDDGGFVTKRYANRRRGSSGGSSYGVVFKSNSRSRIPLRPSRRSAFNQSVKKEYARRVASKLPPSGPKEKTLSKRRVVVLKHY